MILFATQNLLPDTGGMQIYVAGQADALAGRGHEIAAHCDATSAGAAHKVDESDGHPLARFAGLRLWLRSAKRTAETAQQFGRRHHSPEPLGASTLLVGFRLRCGDQAFRGGAFAKMRL